MSRLHAVYVSILLAGFAAAQERTKGNTDPIKRLLKERRDVLEKLMAVLTNQYKQGVVDFTRVAQAAADARRATLELVDGLEARIAALRQYQEIATKLVDLTKERFQNGAATEADWLQATAMLLEVRVELLREEAKVKPKK